MTTQRAAWIFVTPALVVIGVFFLLPVAAAFALSLTDFDLYALADIRNLRFIGLRNYADVLAAPLFWKSLGNTLYFVVAGVPLSIGASLGAALLLNSPLARARGLFRTALFAPVVTTVVAVALIWKYLFHTRYGLINYALGHLRPALTSVSLLGQPVITALLSVPLLGEGLSWAQVGGGALVLAGIALATRRGRPARTAAPTGAGEPAS